MLHETTVAEKRREPRQPGEGEVHLSADEPLGPACVGRLIDVSKQGFRAAHDCAEIRSGLVLRFRHPTGSGLARVVWTRITNQGMEAGFFLL